MKIHFDGPALKSTFCFSQTGIPGGGHTAPEHTAMSPCSRNELKNERTVTLNVFAQVSSDFSSKISKRKFKKHKFYSTG